MTIVSLVVRILFVCFGGYYFMYGVTGLLAGKGDHGQNLLLTLFGGIAVILTFPSYWDGLWDFLTGQPQPWTPSSPDKTE